MESCPLTDESHFGATSYPQRQVIWRKVGTRFHHSYIMERDCYGGPAVDVWGGIMLKCGLSSTFSTKVL
ncbi:hypothetical protein TNCV_3550341 [Trichonephila clavipes]|nr:hypothetical protein TNCV_3550341 [Trichonephila clavipes]